MKVRFNFNKDNHYKGEVIDISVNDFSFWYWTRKKAISKIDEKPPQTAEEKPKTAKRKGAK